jgi:hypothetical protein
MITVKYLNKDNKYSVSTLPEFIKTISDGATMPEMGIVIAENTDRLYVFSSTAGVGKITLISYINGVTSSRITPRKLIDLLQTLLDK